MKEYKRYLYAGLPALGVLFYLIYLHMASIDMVYSDYIRLINSYLPDVWNPKKFFVPDLLTRIPVNYLERGINVQFFGYSVAFDRVMGVIGFGLSALVIGAFSRAQKIGVSWYLAIMAVMFSLNKWEMLYNGTGWAHFLAFACFYYNYYVLDRIYGKRERLGDRVLVFILPVIVTIGIAGPYCAIYSVTLILAYLFIWVRNRLIVLDSISEWEREVASEQTAAGDGKWKNGSPARKKLRANRAAGPIGVIDKRLCKFSGAQITAAAACAVLPLLLYVWSNSRAVYEYSGAVDAPLLATLFAEPKFFLTFLLKSFSSMIFGVELIHRHLSWVPDIAWCALGAVVVAAYLFALWLNFSCRIAERTILPLMLLAAGGMNHLLVLASRWIFMPNDSYGMSSRYALQFQIGIVGILLTFALAARGGWRKRGERGKTAIRITGRTGGRTGRRWSAAGTVRGGFSRRLALVFTALFLAGNLATTAEEFSFAKHRKNHNMEVKEIVLNFENETDETLNAALEYHKDGTRRALTILKENGWNIFKDAENTQNQEVE